MSHLTKRNKRPSRFGSGPNLGLGDISRLSGIAETNKRTDREDKIKREKEIEQAKIDFDVSVKLGKQIKEANKGCFISNGKKICDAGEGKLFVSPEQFAKNLETLIIEDLPKAALAVSVLAGVGVEVPFIIAAAAAATRGVGFQQSGFGPTATADPTKATMFRKAGKGTIVRKKRRNV